MKTEGELVEYIRDKNNSKCGVIKACKVDLGDKKEVFIIHTKVHSNKDTFDKSMMEHIIDCRLEFMCDYAEDQKSGKTQKRIKNINSITKKTINLYENITKRAVSYFKDCDVFRWYIDCFDYIPDYKHNNKY